MATTRGRLRIGVVVHPTRDVADSLAVLTAWAAEQDAQVVCRASDRDRAGSGVVAVDDAEFDTRVDAVASFGGDGTMLGAMRLVARRPVPVLGVNHGTLGFLVEVSPSGLDAALARLAQGRFTIEPHRGLQVEATPGPGRTPPAALDPTVAFNDVVLTRRGRPGAVSVDLGINGARYGYYRCDAVVVATSTGSTAYSYAAGGPIVSPSAAATVITPVAPMSGIARSVVFGVDDVITLHLDVDRGSERNVDVDVDGVEAGTVDGNGAVVVRALPAPAQVVRLDGDAHARRARVKLSLLDLPLRPDQLQELVPLDRRRAEAERHR